MGDALTLTPEQLARAADLCLSPWRHAVRLRDPSSDPDSFSDKDAPLDWTLRIEARGADGARQPLHDLELEIYRSGRQLNLLLSRPGDEAAAMLWHGSHPVWLRADNGERCERPADGASLEAFCRRVRALIGGGADGD
jgi:hypothetical protein